MSAARETQTQTTEQDAPAVKPQAAPARASAPRARDGGPLAQAAPPAVRLGGESGMARDTSAEEASRSSLPPVVHEVLRSPGRPLDAETRAHMEPRFGQDFGHVRLHTDQKAAESARATSALAYTVGPHVVFGAGQYAPRTPQGQSLLAHELAHVVQQDSRIIQPARAGGLTLHYSSALEAEADRAAHHAGGRVLKVSSLPGLILQRQKAPLSMPAGAIGSYIPSLRVEKKFPGKSLPTIETPTFTVKGALALVVRTTLSPTDSYLQNVAFTQKSVFPFTDQAVNVELGNFATSFNLAKGGKGVEGVTFTSNYPGVSPVNTHSIAYEPPFTWVWASRLNPPPSTFKTFKLTGQLRIQLEVTLIPKQPPLSPQKVPSTKSAPAVRPLSHWDRLVLVYGGAMALSIVAGEIAAILAQSAWRAVTAPFYLLDVPGLYDGGGVVSPGKMEA